MNITNELFYREYFLFQGIAGGPFAEKAFFCLLADIFCIDKEDTGRLYAETRKDVVMDIDSVESYARYKRIKEYEEMQGHALLIDKETDALITIKGEALKSLKKYELNIASDATDGQIALALTEQAYRGNVVALRALGLLECEGVNGYDAGMERGLENLTKAARWNDLTGALALLHYDEEHRAERAKILAAILSHAPYRELAKKVEERYGVSMDVLSPETLIIKNALAHGKVAPLFYDASIGRVAFSRAIPLEDKKKIIYAGNPALIAEVCELPLGLHFSSLSFDEGAFDRAPFDLSGVKDSITTNLMNADLRDKSLYLPLLLSADSDYASDMLVSLARDLFADAKVITVDVKALRQRDIVRTKNNVFVRDLSREKDNVILLVMDGNIDDYVIEEISDFLKGEKRADFNLEAPSLSLDLSSVLPICICDRENARKLSEETEVVELAPFGKQRNACMLSSIFEERKKAFGVTTASLVPEAATLLATLPIDSAESIIDKLLRAYRVKRGDATITEAAVREAMKGLRTKTFGFGGNGYDED